MSELIKRKEHRYYLTYVTGEYSEILMYTFGVLPQDNCNNENTQDVVECNIQLSENESIITEFYTNDDKDYMILIRKLELLEDCDIQYSDILAAVYNESEE